MSQVAKTRVQVQLLLPDDVLEELRLMAELNCRTLSREISYRLLCEVRSQLEEESQPPTPSADLRQGLVP